MGFWIFVVILVGIILAVLMVRNFNYNHRFGEGLFKDSEYFIDEKDDFVDKNYYDKDALKK